MFLGLAARDLPRVCRSVATLIFTDRDVVDAV